MIPLLLGASLLNGVGALPAMSQAPGTAQEEQQKRNIQAMGALLGTPSANSPMMQQQALPTALVWSPAHTTALNGIDAQIAAVTNGSVKAELSKHKALMQLHFSQEEWKLPLVNDKTPDPLLSVAFKPQGLSPVLYQVLLWNHAALDLTAVDHTGVPAGQDPSLYPQYAEQFGPPCSSRALAIVHLAMLEALNLVEKTYSSYKAAIGTMSIGDAVVQSLQISASSLTKITVDENSAVEYAAYVALAKLYPYQAAYLTPKWRTPSDASISAGVTGLNASARITLGRKIGTAVAEEVLKERSTDTSQLSGRCIIGGEISDLPTSAPATPATLITYGRLIQYIPQS